MTILHMSTDDITDVANKDTPSSVTVPNTMTGLITWAVGRFGGAALISIVALYFLAQIYADMRVQNAAQMGDMKAQNAATLEVVRAQTAASVQVTAALQELSRQVEKIGDRPAR